MALTDGLVSYYSLGNVADAHGSNTLTNNGVTFGAGKVGDAAIFDDGSEQYLSLASKLLTALPFSVSLWFKKTVFLSAQAVFLRQYNEDTQTLDFAVTTDGFDVIVVGSGSSSVGALLDTDWHHLVWTNDALGIPAVYFDGENVGGTSVSIDPSDGNFTVGGAFDGSSASEFMDGSIDEVGVWDRALSAVEAGQLYNGGNGLAYPLTVATPPVAAFSGTPLSGTAPLSVAFTDASTETPTEWDWEKNDGSGWVPFAGTPTTQNPTEVFTSGTWSVRLTATNAGGSDTETKTDYISVSRSYPDMTVARSTGALLGTNETTGVEIAAGATTTGSEVDILADNASTGYVSLYATFSGAGTTGNVEIKFKGSRVSGQAYDWPDLTFNLRFDATGKRLLKDRVPVGRYVTALVRNATNAKITNVAVLYELEKLS